MCMEWLPKADNTTVRKYTHGTNKEYTRLRVRWVFSYIYYVYAIHVKHVSACICLCVCMCDFYDHRPFSNIFKAQVQCLLRSLPSALLFVTSSHFFFSPFIFVVGVSVVFLYIFSSFFYDDIVIFHVHRLDQNMTPCIRSCLSVRRL